MWLQRLDRAGDCGQVGCNKVASDFGLYEVGGIWGFGNVRTSGVHRCLVEELLKARWFYDCSHESSGGSEGV